MLNLKRTNLFYIGNSPTLSILLNNLRMVHKIQHEIGFDNENGIPMALPKMWLLLHIPTPDAVTELVERGPRMWEIGSFLPGLVKQMTY